MSNMSIASSLADLEATLAEIGEVVSLVYVLATWAQNGIMGVVLYIIGWSIVSLMFEAVGKDIPSPLKVLWRIFEELVGIFL